MTMLTATEAMMRVDVRQRRAQSLAAAVMDKVHREINAINPDDIQHQAAEIVYYAMLDVMCDEGVEVLTDHTRSAAGLPPRGPDGWTIEEILALERARLDALMAPRTYVIPKENP